MGTRAYAQVTERTVTTMRFAKASMTWKVPPPPSSLAVKNQAERGAMLERLDNMDPSLRQRLSEERLTDYPDTLRRMGKGLAKEG